MIKLIGYPSCQNKLMLLAHNSMLIKRPILIFDDKVLVGFNVKDCWSC